MRMEDRIVQLTKRTYDDLYKQIAELEVELEKLKKQIQLMHNNGLGESWVERFEKDVAGKDKQIAELQEELAELEAEKAAFNKGWEAARKGEPKGDLMDEEEHGWIVFSYDKLKAENERLEKCVLAKG